MRIVQLTISQDYFMSDHWENIFNNDENSEIFTLMKTFSHWDSGMQSAMLCNESKISEMSEFLASYEIPFTIHDCRDNFVIYLTDAPESYDGFGTFTVDEHAIDARRIVAIPVQYAESWQLPRYSSGLYAAELLATDPTV